MDVTKAYNQSTTISPNQSDSDKVISNPKAVLGKDDFLKLLLIELQYQDPTDPMDSEKILTQTSQLATLEASDNTKKTLDNLSKTLTQTSSLSALSAIGKIGSLGTDSILVDEENSPTFELYFPQQVQSGTLTIKNTNGDIVKTFDFDALPSGVNPFTWDATDDSGNRVSNGHYYVKAHYTATDGSEHTTSYGYLPIESVRFDNGKANLKMGSHYYPIDQLKEIIGG